MHTHIIEMMLKNLYASVECEMIIKLADDSICDYICKSTKLCSMLKQKANICFSVLNVSPSYFFSRIEMNKCIMIFANVHI